MFSVFVYCLLRLFGIKIQLIERTLKDLNCLSRKHSHEWALRISEEEDPYVILGDDRGGSYKDEFYDIAIYSANACKFYIETI